MTYDQWKTRDPNEPYNEQSEDEPTELDQLYDAVRDLTLSRDEALVLLADAQLRIIALEKVIYQNLGHRRLADPVAREILLEISSRQF